MSLSKRSHPPLESWTPPWFMTARRYLGSRLGLVALAAAVLTLGAALNWRWLVAVGAAPLLLSALPCVAMCALGLCMNRSAGRTCSHSNDGPAQDKTDQAADAPKK